MKSFTYERANSPAEAAAAVARVSGAKFIAGGTNLLDLMKLQIETPTHLIDVNDLGLDKIEPTPDGGLRIGASVRNTTLAADERVRRDYGVLTRAIVAGASGQIRNMATTAGGWQADLSQSAGPCVVCLRAGICGCRRAGRWPGSRRAGRRGAQALASRRRRPCNAARLEGCRYGARGQRANDRTQCIQGYV